MWGQYSARGQIDTGFVRGALAGPAWALHSIDGWGYETSKDDEQMCSVWVKEWLRV